MKTLLFKTNSPQACEKIFTYYLSDFLSKNKNLFSEALSISEVPGNTKLNKVPSKSCRVLILDRVINITDNIQSTVEEAFRILSKDGILIITASCIVPTKNTHNILYGITPKALLFIVKKYFNVSGISATYGNVLVGRYLIGDINIKALNKTELDYPDPFFPVLGIVAISKNKELKTLYKDQNSKNNQVNYIISALNNIGLGFFAEELKKMQSNRGLPELEKGRNAKK